MVSVRQSDEREVSRHVLPVEVTSFIGRQAELEEPARLFGAAEELRELAGIAIWPANLAGYERDVTPVQECLAPEERTRAWEAGRALPLERVLTDLLDDASPDGEAGLPTANPLTPRELEVARLVSQGLTNRQIGSTLFITEGTARLHVKHILQKLSFSSRAQIAAWVAGGVPNEAPFGNGHPKCE